MEVYSHGTPSDSTQAAARSVSNSMESSADVFGPLWSLVHGLRASIEIMQEISEEKRSLDNLRDRLEEILGDLAPYLAGSNVMMASACLYLTREVEVLNASMNSSAQADEQMIESRLTRILPSMSVIYNSAESGDVRRVGCTLGTRKAQIQLLLEWANTPDAGRTFWMTGMAGTGKTTIAYTICNELDKSCRLGASFFCTRMIPECCYVKYIIPSIAHQLSRFSLPFRYALAKILESDPDAHT
ncbi:unnamed protein product [Rhizoctonia solani]|uniref:Nephrocystin 3-like N-terminal domain-containing protein n=1 Tax=Rhizoctonia solani TaxID=456999 RepID=A0A8H3BR79_9AGAM|nr:unnamed protein product [Rhizoctonia solani]